MLYRKSLIFVVTLVCFACRDYNIYLKIHLSTYYLDIGQIDLCILKEQDKLAYMFYKASHKR